MPDPSAFRQAVKAQTGNDVVVCPHCTKSDVPSEHGTLEPQPSGRIFCNVCGMMFWPVTQEMK